MWYDLLDPSKVIIKQSLKDLSVGKKKKKEAKSIVKSNKNNWSITSLKPVLNWANVCLPEHTSDTSTNYDSFLN